MDTVAKLTRSVTTADSVFFTATVPNNATSVMESSDWDKIKPSRSHPTQLAKGWTDVVHKYLKKSNPYCPLMFKWHKAKRFSSRLSTARYSFIACGYCSFATCPLKFKVFMLSSEERQLVLHIEYNGDVKHDLSMRKACPITGETRQEMLKYFINTSKKPSTTHHDRVDKIGSSSFSAGNWSGAGASVNVVQQIASEARRALRLDDNPIVSLDKMRKEFMCEDSSSSLKIKGYIQHIAATPLVVRYFALKRLWFLENWYFWVHLYGD